MNLIDRVRILWAGARYDFWLDLNSVPRKKRRELRRELRANLAEAAGHVGTSKALLNVGGMRKLAAESTRDGAGRSRWSAGITVGMVTFCTLIVLFFAASLYYAEGVLDTEVTGPVRSSLFPFLGSTVEINNQGAGQGIEIDASFGPVPLLLPLAMFILVAKPWRSLAGRQDLMDADSSI